MEHVTPAQLAGAASIPLDRAIEWAIFLDNAVHQFDIVTPRRKAAFVATCAHESAFFKRTVENMNYSRPERIVAVYGSRFRAPAGVNREQYQLALARPYVNRPQALANFVYANRCGNGDFESGDGWRYRGRGLIQITYRNNYERVGDGLGLDLLGQPELLEERGFAAISAAWWWSAEGLNDLADKGMIDAISGIVNRGDPNKVAIGQEDRRMIYHDGLQVFDV